MGAQVRVLFLDTGLHFRATLELRRQVEHHFGIAIDSLQPALSLDEQSAEYGDALWLRDPDACCNLRKIEPLRLALVEVEAWITGTRRSASPTRAQVELVSWDQQFGLTKVNPLARWPREKVLHFLREHRVPTNPLIDDGYPSIGCQPCTHRVTPEQGVEDERAGRWTGQAKTECGIHRDTRTSRIPKPRDS